MAKSYPYTAWYLAPSCTVKRVVVVGKGFYSRYEKLENGKAVHLDGLFVSKKEAIAAGRRLVSAQAVRLAISEQNIDKRARRLDKAEAENG